MEVNKTRTTKNSIRDSMIGRNKLSTHRKGGLRWEYCVQNTTNSLNGFGPGLHYTRGSSTHAHSTSTAQPYASDHMMRWWSHIWARLRSLCLLLCSFTFEHCSPSTGRTKLHSLLIKNQRAVHGLLSIAVFYCLPPDAFVCGGEWGHTSKNTDCRGLQKHWHWPS